MEGCARRRGGQRVAGPRRRRSALEQPSPAAHRATPRLPLGVGSPLLGAL